MTKDIISVEASTNYIARVYSSVSWKGVFLVYLAYLFRHRKKSVLFGKKLRINVPGIVINNPEIIDFKYSCKKNYFVFNKNALKPIFFQSNYGRVFIFKFPKYK